MLCLSMIAGEYLTINDNIVVKLDQVYASRTQLMIQAPRDVPVIRGAVLERAGGKRPDCIVDMPRRHRTQLPWDKSKAHALHIMRETLAHMEDSPETRMLRESLEQMFPQHRAGNKDGQPAVTQVSPGNASRLK